MKISLLGSNLSMNETGRLYILARMLSRYHDVQISGLSFANGDAPTIWGPVDDGTVSYRPVRSRSFLPSALASIPSVLKTLDGDIVYAEGLLGSSYGVALIKKLVNRTRLVLDIGDWELGHLVGNSWKSRVRTFGRRAFDINGPMQLILLEQLKNLADARTTSSSFGARRFGAELIPHARDTEHLNPANFDVNSLKERRGLEGKRVVMFLGSPKGHKGVDDLIQAFNALNDNSAVLMIVGADPNGSYTHYLKSLTSADVRFVGHIPFHEVPEYISVADVMVIPQRDTPSSRGQMPAKVYDAMAMAKPTIASRIGDLPETLEGCGYLFEPGNTEQLTELLAHVISNPGESEELGLQARRKCVEKYSWDANAPKLSAIMESVR
jgi:glycosyltransferase involved in cell wall biosynthesis